MISKLTAAALPPVLLQGARFLMTGGLVALIYILVTTVLSPVMPFDVALAIGYAVSIATHFTLQRVFVWNHDAGFQLGLRAQLVRYLPMAAVQYGLTAASTGLLPHRLGVGREPVYLVTVAVLSLTTFVVFRSSIFHRAGAPEAVPSV